jgi:hypothetical protein
MNHSQWLRIATPVQQRVGDQGLPGTTEPGQMRMVRTTDGGCSG